MPRYPGLGLNVYYNDEPDEHYPTGAHGGSLQDISSATLAVRELAMMSVMDQLTDKENWHKKVFDETIVAKWRSEALAIPDKYFCALATNSKYRTRNDKNEVVLRDDDINLDKLIGIMSTTSFEYCIQELRSKAKHYESTGLIPTLDSCASIVKADNLVPLSLDTSLRRAFDALREEQSAAPDWHPNSNDMVQDLIHPSMYPLVYGRSRVLADEVVGVHDAIRKWAGKGDTVGTEHWDDSPNIDHRGRLLPFGAPSQCWSDTYQWLPSNVAFQDDGTVKFTSYINNLHPEKFPDIYRAVEKLIETSLPAWDQCLATDVGQDGDCAGRHKSRFPYPDNADDHNGENWTPSDPEEVANVQVDWSKVDPDGHAFDPQYDDEIQKKWEWLRKPAIPEPISEDVNYATMPEYRLAHKFRDSGLQVIVKMASIELTPEKPEFPAGGWHVEGQMNERICATALYYVDCENVSPSSLAFRMQTSLELHEDIDVGQDSYSWAEQIYGTHLGVGHDAPCLQNYGSVDTRQGRLLAFPNVFQHRVSPFHLKDANKPGHRRFIALWLVDPTWRVISTANVPPQQADWWAGSVFGDSAEAQATASAKVPFELMTLLKDYGLVKDIPGIKQKTLPPELREMVREHFRDDGPMSLEEAKEHRLKLMDARSAFIKTDVGQWRENTHSFCEH